MSRRWWLVPSGVGLFGLGISWLAFWAIDQADARRVRNILEVRAEWRARDLEAKLQLSGSAVENIAVAVAANAPFDPESFRRIGRRVRSGVGHIQALQWAPRVLQAEIPAFEQAARANGLPEYRVFDVTPDFRASELEPRDEYFPVLFDARFIGSRRVEGLALGRYEGRRLPMENARDQGQPVAATPVRPIGPPVPELVYLLFWPVYAGAEVPATVDERRAKLRGYAVGNFNLIALLDSALRDTSELAETIYFSVTATRQDPLMDSAVAIYSPGLRQVRLMPRVASAADVAVQLQRHFVVFGQHWGLTFEYAPAAVAELRSRAAWGWLAAGLLLTASLVFYLLREHGRTRAIEALVAQRTAELQKTSAELHQAQKMEALGNLTGGVAHDFNNLLTVIIGNLDLAASTLDRDPQTKRLLELALDSARRGGGLIRQLLAFSRRQRLTPQPTDTNELVAGMLQLLSRTLGEDIQIAFQPAPTVWPVMIDSSLLSSAMINLATNARDAMPRGGKLTIATRNVHLDPDYAALNPDVTPGDFVLLEVSDSGIGMSPETLGRAFEPFFTTKETSHGTGLGLSMVFGFVKQSQGHIKLYSEPGRGTTVRLYLRRAKSDATAPAVAATAQELPGGRETIMLVEDKADVRQVVARQLTQLGYTVIEAATPHAALAELQSADTRVDLLFTDLIMPGGMNGHELIEAALELRPGLKALYMSGYPGGALRDGHPLTMGENFLSKPFRKHELARKLREILDG